MRNLLVFCSALLLASAFLLAANERTVRISGDENVLPILAEAKRAPSPPLYPSSSSATSLTIGTTPIFGGGSSGVYTATVGNGSGSTTCPLGHACVAYSR